MNPLKGARPVPAATQMTGVFSTSWGRWKAACEGRTAMCSLSPGARDARYDDATPTCTPWPDLEGASSTEKVRVTWEGFHRGDEEMELRCVSRISFSIVGFKYLLLSHAHGRQHREESA